MIAAAHAALATVANDPEAAHLDDIDPAQLTELIPLRAVTLPSGRGAKRVHVATLYRWTEHGCRGERLRYVQVGATGSDPLLSAHAAIPVVVASACLSRWFHRPAL